MHREWFEVLDELASTGKINDMNSEAVRDLSKLGYIDFMPGHDPGDEHFVFSGKGKEAYLSAREHYKLEDERRNAESEREARDTERDNREQAWINEQRRFLRVDRVIAICTLIVAVVTALITIILR